MIKIEIDLPNQPSQILPEAVLRRLFEQGRVNPNTPARIEGDPAWSTVVEVLDGLARRRQSAVPSSPGTVTRAGASTPRDHEAVVFAMKRYGHGQALVKGLGIKANLLQAIGVILGLVIAAAAWVFLGSVMLSQRGPLWAAPLLAALLGFGIYAFFAARATFLRVQASLLAATIDTAVYVCPFLENSDRLVLLRRES
jgi:hypothetical protein